MLIRDQRTERAQPREFFFRDLFRGVRKADCVCSHVVKRVPLISAEIQPTEVDKIADSDVRP